MQFCHMRKDIPTFNRSSEKTLHFQVLFGENVRYVPNVFLTTRIMLQFYAICNTANAYYSIGFGTAVELPYLSSTSEVNE